MTDAQLVAIHSPAPPFAHLAGPHQAKLVLVGEAWGESESETGLPFAGESGKELFRMLGEAMPDIEPDLHAFICSRMRYGNEWIVPRERWLAQASIAFTNVLAFRPTSNKLDSITVPRAQVPKDYDLPPMGLGKYLPPEYLGELARLRIELEHLGPNLVVCLGNTATWACLRATNIGSIRGATALGHKLGPAAQIKCLGTYHPAGVMRQWGWRPIVVADLMKAHRESQYPDIRRPKRQVLINPTLDELENWVNDTLANPPPWLSPDIETGASQIKCIGFARSQSEAIVVPFVNLAHWSGSFWPTLQEELQAWELVRKLLESDIPKVGQNFLYDLQYIVKYGISPRNVINDTMLLHHSMFPEMQKGLGFLGSIYTNEASWKLMRAWKSDSEKRDE